MNITERHIEKTRDGFYLLPCDGRHDPNWHKYLYYTKKEVVRLWRSEHPKWSSETLDVEKGFTLTSWADGFGIWHCRADFDSPGVGNVGRDEELKYSALAACKRRIRKEIVEREKPKQVGRLSYEVVANRIDSMNRMWSITVAEKI